MACGTPNCGSSGSGTGNAQKSGGQLRQPTPGLVTVNNTPDPAKNYGLWEIPILLISYLPLDSNGKIDISVTGDVDLSLADARQKIASETALAIDLLEQGSRFRTYNNPSAVPSLAYRIMTRVEVQESFPLTWGYKWNSLGFNPPLVNYTAIISRWKQYMTGIKQVWIWGYHGGLVTIWESAMTGPFGNASNSPDMPGLLPDLGRSYTVFTYNLGRDADAMVHNHGHDFEAKFEAIDKATWQKFTGTPDYTTFTKSGGAVQCGNCHFPPNALTDYEYNSSRQQLSTIADWRPDGTGQAVNVNCETWGACSDDGGKAWYKYWMQSLPGADNGLGCSNWWHLIGDFDDFRNRRMGLVS